MTWLTSLPAAVLVISGLVLALLVVVGARLAVRALVPAAERDAAYTIAAPLMPALGAIFALLMGLTLASEVGFLASAQGIVSSEAADASRLAWAATSPGVDSEPIQSALLGYLQAVVEIACKRPDLGPAFRDWLVEFVAQETAGLGG